MSSWLILVVVAPLQVYWLPCLTLNGEASPVSVTAGLLTNSHIYAIRAATVGLKYSLARARVGTGAW